MDYNTLVDMATELGYRLALSGAETFRVEESISLILRSYGLKAEVFAIPNCLIVSASTDSGMLQTRMRRIGDHGNNLDAVECYNNLSRRICAENPDPETAMQWLNETQRTQYHHSKWVRLLGYYLAGAGFAIFFGGTILDFVFAGICGIMIGAIGAAMSKLQANQFFTTIVSAFCIALFAYLLGASGLTERADTIIIGSMMLLVPGLLFTNAMRDIIYGDTNSGVNRIVQVILIAMALALGTAAAWSMVEVAWAAPTSIPGHDYHILIQLTGAALGCIGFSLLYNIHGFGVALCTLGGVLSWAAYYLVLKLTGSSLLGYFGAAVTSAVYAESMARIRKFPAISYLVISIFPMIPGAGVYYTMNYAIQGNMDAFTKAGTEAISIAGVIAVGILLISTGFRLWSNMKRIRCK